MGEIVPFLPSEGYVVSFGVPAASEIVGYQGDSFFDELLEVLGSFEFVAAVSVGVDDAGVLLEGDRGEERGGESEASGVHEFGVESSHLLARDGEDRGAQVGLLVSGSLRTDDHFP